MSPICGQCGADMEYRKIAPCFECGARPNEIDEYKEKSHKYYSCKLFDNAIFCDFCINDLESTDPMYWGFPPKYDWNEDGGDWNATLCTEAKSSMGWVCTQCSCTENQQLFVVKNAKKYEQKLPNVYWKYL